MTGSDIPETALLAIANRLDYLLLIGRHVEELEAFARLVHASGPHADGRFVAVDAGRLPETLIEAELCSHVKGAFEGSVCRRMGRLELASGGTLFLANVQTLGASTQLRLLRVLDLNVAAPLGADDEQYAVSARVIAGSSDDLVDAVREGRFRQDLYERLAATVIKVPSALAGS